MRRPLTLATLLILVVPASAVAVHWPHYGGDAGRSGNQPVDPGTAPVVAAWSQTAAADQQVITSMIASDGPVDQQRLVYGTAARRIHVRQLATGAAVGAADGVNIDEGTSDP